MLARDRGRCQKCGARGKPGDCILEIHHIVEVCEGGQHDVDNLVTLCFWCHRECTDGLPCDATFEEWIALPPVRSFARLLVLAHRNTPEALAMVATMANTTLVQFVGMLNDERRRALEEP